MSKILAVMIAGLFAAGAYAQNPKGASSEQQPVFNTKPQERAQAKDNAKPQGVVKQQSGDRSTSPEINPEASGGKAAVTGQNKANAKSQGMAKKPAGDTVNSPEINPEASGGKAATAGQAKIDARNSKAAAKKQATTN
jgi:hypothetical protein